MVEVINRRSLLGAMLVAGVAPAILRPGLIMPIKPRLLLPSPKLYDVLVTISDVHGFGISALVSTRSGLRADGLHFIEDSAGNKHQFGIEETKDGPVGWCRPASEGVVMQVTPMQRTSAFTWTTMLTATKEPKGW